MISAGPTKINRLRGRPPDAGTCCPHPVGGSPHDWQHRSHASWRGSGTDAVRQPHQRQAGQSHDHQRPMVPEGPAPARGRAARGEGLRQAAAARTRSAHVAGGRRRAAPAAAGVRRLPARGCAAGAAIIPAHCRVQLVLKPSSDSLINMELWLPPADKWNGKFMGVGNGGFAGSIQGMANEMPQALRLGYATAGTDTGHQEPGRRMGDRPSGEDDRLRLSRHARDDAEGEAARQGLLRPERRSTRTSRAARPAAAWR